MIEVLAPYYFVGGLGVFISCVVAPGDPHNSNRPNLGGAFTLAVVWPVGLFVLLVWAVILILERWGRG